MAVDLQELADQVTDESSFLEFVAALARDWGLEKELEQSRPSDPYSSGALGWENCSLGAYLNAAHAWGIASTGGLRFYERPSNPWTRAAQILLAGKFYE